MRAALLILVALAGTAEAQQPYAKRLAGVHGIVYVAEVAPGIYRGGVPDKQGVAFLKQLGIKTVVNLRHFHGENEGELVRAAGLRYERIPLESSDPPKPKSIDRFMTLITDPSLRPIYVHCLHGVDRTGAMMAVYRMEIEGWDNARAFGEMIYFGAHSIWRDLQTFVKKYRPSGRYAARVPATN